MLQTGKFLMTIVLPVPKFSLLGFPTLTVLFNLLLLWWAF